MSDDLVRRDVINKLLCQLCKNNWIEGCTMTPDDCPMMEFFTDRLPTACQEQKWIPCAERLPEIEKEVWTYFPTDSTVCINWLICDTMWGMTKNGNDPTYWMPIPKPNPPQEICQC